VLWSLLDTTDVLAALIGTRDSNTVITPFTEWASTKRQLFLASHIRQFMFKLVEDIHFSYIGSLYWEEVQRHVPWSILRMSINRASTICSVSSWPIYVPIGCRHPSIKYWHPLLAKTTAKCSLLYPENECHWSVNSFSCCIFVNQVIVLIFTFITELLTAIIGKNPIYQW
jgi:hypothetical protein